MATTPQQREEDRRAVATAARRRADGDAREQAQRAAMANPAWRVEAPSPPPAKLVAAAGPVATDSVPVAAAPAAALPVVQVQGPAPLWQFLVAGAVAGLTAAAVHIAYPYLAALL